MAWSRGTGYRHAGMCVLLALALGVAPACSIRQVRGWFAVNRRIQITDDTARAIANTLNEREPNGCDGNYSGTCVPTNLSEIHCIGEDGNGPELRGPFDVTGWDHFGLDRDGNRRACEGTSPVGSVDWVVEPVEGSIRVGGWALDHDALGPIDVHAYDTGTGRSFVANTSRSDLGHLGRGANHGFDISWTATPGLHNVCVYAINTDGGSNSLLGCRWIEVAWRLWMLQLVNDERAKAGVDPMTACGTLNRSAEDHSTDQAVHQNMSHTGSDGSDISDRVERTGYTSWTGLGENVAYGYESVPEVVDAWMNSPGHRANILSSVFTHFGAGRATDSRGAIAWTQNFGRGGAC